MKTYVKKLWSTHPSLYFYIELEDALMQHYWYQKINKCNIPFDEWLDYEIDTQPKEKSKCNQCGGRFK
jgi:hypothetical protein